MIFLYQFTLHGFASVVGVLFSIFKRLLSFPLFCCTQASKMRTKKPTRREMTKPTGGHHTSCLPVVFFSKVYFFLCGCFYVIPYPAAWPFHIWIMEGSNGVSVPRVEFTVGKVVPIFRLSHWLFPWKGVPLEHTTALHVTGSCQIAGVHNPNWWETCLTLISRRVWVGMSQKANGRNWRVPLGESGLGELDSTLGGKLSVEI